MTAPSAFRELARALGSRPESLTSSLGQESVHKAFSCCVDLATTGRHGGDRLQMERKIHGGITEKRIEA
ncbi:hypothetical protein RRG08_059519 [Elysia crispata]|uniref:Uncharacterized protein n=1 Tax=Elysia crispata TaxID=231223 RepID=A0AAE1D1V3_9GAST|nr:hypothetical protein RRG08_059519 [Elysia crispata]